MKIVIQRVSRASVAVDGKVIAAIEQGLLLLVGFGEGDTEQTLPDGGEGREPPHFSQ